MKTYYFADYIYILVCKRIRLKEKQLWGIFTGPRGLKNILDRGGQGCRIISV
jgi:hypothetical protein